jgi:hypothetical protein
VCAGLAVSLAATLPFVSGLRGYFLSDDFGLVQLFSRQPAWHVLSLFTRSWVEGIYGYAADELRPTVALSYQLDSLWGAASPLAYHATNVVLHVLSALVVLAVARSAARLTLAAAAFAAGVFAVWPIHAETVAWISGRADSVPGLLYLSAFLAYAAWRRAGAGALYAACLGLAVLALYSKQSAITLTASFLAYDLLVAGAPGHRGASPRGACEPGYAPTRRSWR